MRLDDGTEVILPDGFEEDEWLFESKGVVVVDVIDSRDRRFPLTCVERGRLLQELSDVLDGPYFQMNMVVLERVNLAQIAQAVEWLVASGMSGVCPASQ